MSQFTTGTVDLTNGSPTVSAALGVDWGGLSLPALFNVQGDSGVVVYDVTAFNAPAPGSRWTLTLAAPFAGVSADNASYAISRDFTPVLGLPLLNFGDVNTAGLFNRAMKKLDGSIVVATGPQGIQGEQGPGITSVEVIGTDETGTTVRIHYGESSSVDVLLPAGADGADGGVGPEGPQGPAGPGITSITVLDANHIRIFYGESSHVDVELPAGPAGADGRGIASVTNTDDPTVALVTFTDATTSDLTLPSGATGATGGTGTAGSVIHSGAAAPTSGTGANGDFYLETTNARMYGPKAAGAWGGYITLRGMNGADGGTGATGLGIAYIVQSGDLHSITVHMTDGTDQGPFTLPPGPTGATGADGLPSWVAGPAGDTGVGILSIEQSLDLSTITVHLTNSTDQGPFTLPPGPAGADGAASTVAGPPGVGIASISQPTGSTLLLNLTDSTTQGPFDLPVSAPSTGGATFDVRLELNAPLGAGAAPINVYTDTSATTPATAAGDAVKAWKDPASGLVFTQTTTVKAPVLAIHQGRWVLRCTASQYMTCTTSLALPGLDLWVRARMSPPYVAGVILNGAGADTLGFNTPDAFLLSPDTWSHNDADLVHACMTAMRTMHVKERSGFSTFAINGITTTTRPNVSDTPLTGTTVTLSINRVTYGGGYDDSGNACDIEAILIGHSVSASDAQQVAAYLTPERDFRRIVFDGDSLTDGSYGGFGVAPGEDYPSQFQLLRPEALVINRGNWGERIANVAGRATEVGSYATQGSVYVVLIGRNDLADGMSGSDLLTATAALCRAATANGLAPYVCTQIPEGATPPAWEAERTAFNSALLTGFRAYCRGVIDFAADARLADPTNTTYFAGDHLHQTAAGHRAKAEIAAAAIP